MGAKSNCDLTYGGLPSMGLTLIFTVFGFGVDRLYVGQVGVGIALLISYLTVFGLVLAVPIEWLSSLSLVFSILSNKRTAFMYGCEIQFSSPTIFDKVLAILWILFNLLFIILTVTLLVLMK